MNEGEILEKIKKIFRDTFSDDTPITRDTRPGDVAAWDSMGQIRFLSNIERAFGIKFRMKDIVSFRSIGDIADGVAKSLENNG